MPSLYQIALLAARFFGMMNLISGVTGFLIGIGLILEAIFVRSGMAGAEPIGIYIINYSTVFFVSGIGVLILSKPLARFASKV